MQQHYRVRKKRRPIRVYKQADPDQSTQVYRDSADLDQMSITQQIREHPEIMREKFESAGASKYKAVFHSIYDSVFVTDLLGNIIDANARAEHEFQRSVDELCRMSIIHLVAGADMNLIDTLVENVGQKKYTVLEGHCVRADGSKFIAELTVTRLRTREKGALCFFIRDMTEHKEREKELESATEQLLETERENARLEALSSLYQELNNPLQVLMCMADLEENDEYRNQLGSIAEVLNRLREEADSEQETALMSGSETGAESARPVEEKFVADRVLLVDDEARLLDMFTRIIGSLFPDLTIDTARNGKEAVDQFAMHHHGLIIMDMSMPVMSGDEAYAQIEELSSARKWQMPHLIFCTGFDVTPELKAILGDGSRHLCLRKPLTMTDLVDAVREQRERQQGVAG